MKYDAFLSYSHFLDSTFAPSIQVALQRLGKPWYRVRQLNIFRDETDLSATPQLWAKIEEGLKSSRYLILLASPAAANSEWVLKEIEFWVKNKGLSNIIIVLTSGLISWSKTQNDFNWDLTDLLPLLLSSKFKMEPLFIDFSTIRSDTDLSIGNPQFKINIAKISATIQNITVKELIDQDVQEHRKTIRIRNVVISIILVFLFGLAVTSLIILKQRNAARRMAEANEQVLLAMNRISTTQSLSHIANAYKLNPSPYIANLLTTYGDNPITFYNWFDIKDSSKYLL